MANQFNTTEKGDKFENKSLEIITQVIERQQLGHLATYLKVFQKKEYYSHLRKKNIVFDLDYAMLKFGKLIFLFKQSSFSC